MLLCYFLYCIDTIIDFKTHVNWAIITITLLNPNYFQCSVWHDRTIGKTEVPIAVPIGHAWFPQPWKRQSITSHGLRKITHFSFGLSIYSLECRKPAVSPVACWEISPDDSQVTLQIKASAPCCPCVRKWRCPYWSEYSHGCSGRSWEPSLGFFRRFLPGLVTGGSFLLLKTRCWPYPRCSLRGKFDAERSVGWGQGTIPRVCDVTVRGCCDYVIVVCPSFGMFLAVAQNDSLIGSDQINAHVLQYSFFFRDRLYSCLNNS